MNETTTAEPLTPRRLFPVALMTLGGLVLALGFPNDLLPGALGDRPYPLVAWFALLPLCWGIQALPDKSARWGVWLFSLVFALIHLYWVHLFGILPWLLLALAVSVFPLLAYLFSRWMPWGTTGQVIGFALAFAGLEWLRGLGAFGFPWGEVGMSQVEGSLSCIAAIGGLPLLTVLMLLVVGAVVLRLRDAGAKRLLRVTAALLFACFLAGWWQTYLALSRQARAGENRALTITLVQPSVLRGLTAEDLERPRTLADWQLEQQRRLAILTPLSQSSTLTEADRPRLIVWPESAVPLPPYPPYNREMQTLAWETNSYLLVGAPGYTLPRNAAYLLGPTGAVEDEYDKVHLVPFGEYVPFVRSLIDRFYSIRRTDVVPGDGYRLLRVDGNPLGVGICFESTFSGIARVYGKQGARHLIYLTNDAWFHRTAAVRQHFNQARFRAIETGLPVARCASTGISGFIAPDGRVVQELPVYTRGALTHRVYDGVPGTVYTAWGWLVGPLCLLATIIMLLRGVLTRRKEATETSDGGGA
ncbi:MAG: Apolipoprotein N-acyltransferase [bacterium ADurb.Bin429]|nr:MAG: Apolipoprotein N-acyltransferase [bacterium ADurb.Bin429]